MKIYKITTDKKFVDWDTYDSAIVVANSEEEARNIKDGVFWVQPIKDLHVELVGVANATFTTPCVLVSSFNAG